MTFTHGIHFLSLLEQPKDSMGGGYASKHESTDVGVETAINPTEPVTNGHQDDSSLPASAELTNGHKVEESTDATETVTHGSKADVHPESEESNITLGSVDVALPEEPETHVPTGVASSVPDSDESNIALGSVDVASPEEPETHVPSGMVSPVPASTKLQRLLKGSDDLIVCPGVYDGFSARIAMSVGFQCLYMTGAGTTASRLGMADLGVAQLHDMREHAEMIANLDPHGPPLIADMDTGYGGPIMVANSVSQYIRAGVAGFHIEDQIQNKRCGHLKGKKVVDIETYLARIRAAKGAITRLNSDIVLIARTDALQQYGYDECIKRLKAARDLGADVGLCEGYTSKEMARQAVKDLAPWPLLLNMVENGSTPIITSKEAAEMGFRIMIYSFASLAPAYVAIRDTMHKLKNEGVTGIGRDLTPVKLFEICGLQESMRVDTDAGGLSFIEGV